MALTNREMKREFFTDLAKEMSDDFDRNALEQIKKHAYFCYDKLRDNAKQVNDEGNLRIAKEYLADADAFYMLAQACKNILKA